MTVLVEATCHIRKQCGLSRAAVAVLEMAEEPVGTTLEVLAARCKEAVLDRYCLALAIVAGLRRKNMMVPHLAKRFGLGVWAVLGMLRDAGSAQNCPTLPRLGSGAVRGDLGKLRGLLFLGFMPRAYPPKMIAAPRTSPAKVIAQITTVYFAVSVSIFAFWLFSMLDSCALWVSIFAFWLFSMLDSCMVSVSILAPNWLTKFMDAMVSMSSMSS